MLNTRCRLLQGAAVAGAMLCTALPAAAHPHMCVGLEATVVYEKGAFTGLKEKWTFYDESYIAQAVEGLDKNKDGKLDRSELAELAKVNIEDIKGADYFTFATVGGEPVKLGEATDYWLEHTGDTLSFYFTVPFATAVPAGGKKLEISVRDTEFFIAFGLPKVPESISLGSGTPKSCRLSVELPEAEEQATMKEILRGLGCAVTLPKSISIACGPP
jgi:ABC-type uncharacterized transport system substrate-binding protein